MIQYRVLGTRLNNKSNRLKIISKSLFITVAPVKATFQAFWSTMSINENLLGDYTYKESNTEVASSMFPFDDAEILDLKPRSDIEGVNKDTNSLIAVDMLDRNKTLNQNQVIIGTSGVGKTTYMIQKILRYAIQDYQIYIILDYSPRYLGHEIASGRSESNVWSVANTD